VPLSPGVRLGPYEVTAQIGAGGMGEVYRAHDTHLDRDVAINVLPATLAHDSERAARLEREARLLATLNHPNIAAVYGLEKSASARALVMELVEGPTLADRITGVGDIHVVSDGGGTRPRWRADGRELFYLGPNGRLMSVDITLGPPFRAGTPKFLFQLPQGTALSDTAADGRTLAVVPLESGAQAPFNVVLNWQSALRQ
jgi:hypothetical protein